MNLSPLLLVWRRLVEGEFYYPFSLSGEGWDEGEFYYPFSPSGEGWDEGELLKL